MAETRAVGNDGAITMPSGVHDAVVRSWSANFPRYLANVTGFGDTYEKNRLGIMGVNGTLTCVPKFDASSTSPGVLDRVANGSSLTLQVASGCTYALTAAFNDIGFNIDKTGDAGLTYAFSNGVSDTITETWDETP